MKIDFVHSIDFVDGWSPEALRALVAEARHIVLVAHTNADGDAVGSVTAVYALLTKLSHATVTPLLPDGCPDDLSWMPHADRIVGGRQEPERCAAAIAEADLLVAMDLNGLDRTGVLATPLKERQCKKILFDHHIGPDREHFQLVVSDPEISSTCELIYWVFRTAYGREAFGAESAKSLFAGMCTDTGTFSYSNRQASLYLASSELLAYGVDPTEVNHEIKNVFTLPQLQFFGYAMAHLLTVYAEREVALMVIHAEDMRRFGVQSSELTGLVNEVMKLRCVDCAILVREEEGTVRLSLRSKKHIDVNRLAGELFDGGGHTRAAGATSHLPLAETVEVVKRKLSLGE